MRIGSGFSIFFNFHHLFEKKKLKHGFRVFAVPHLAVSYSHFLFPLFFYDAYPSFFKKINMDLWTKIRSKLAAACYTIHGLDKPALFAQGDKNHDGFLDLAEVKGVFRRVLKFPQEELSDKALRHLFVALDTNRKGKLDFEHFFTLLRDHETVDIRSEISAANSKTRPLSSPQKVQQPPVKKQSRSSEPMPSSSSSSSSSRLESEPQENMPSYSQQQQQYKKKSVKKSTPAIEEVLTDVEVRERKRKREREAAESSTLRETYTLRYIKQHISNHIKREK
jgi:hypothetical protein